MRSRARILLLAITGGIFLLFLAFVLLLLGWSGLHHFSILLIGVAFCLQILFVGTGKPRAIYAGLHVFTWFLFTSIILLTGADLVPWVLIPFAISMILGAMARPLLAWIGSSDAESREDRQSQPADQPLYSPYQQGYRPPPTTPYQEDRQRHSYPQPKDEPLSDPLYEQPQAQYPQEMPPQQ